MGIKHRSGSEMLVDTWEGWPLERFLYFFIALAYVMIWIQLTLFHWRGAFRSRYMWSPVLYTPVLIGMAIILGVIRGGAAETAFVVVFGIGVAEGLIGILLHARGVASYVGRVNLRNLMAGPPIILPIMYMALSCLALLVFYWESISRASL
jgi:hypothetical protein